MVIIWEPSLGVFAKSVVGKFKPLSVDNSILTNEVLILLDVVPATSQVIVCDEFPAHVIPVAYCDVTTNGPALAFTVSIISSRLTFEPRITALSLTVTAKFCTRDTLERRSILVFNSPAITFSSLGMYRLGEAVGWLNLKFGPEVAVALVSGCTPVSKPSHEYV